ncbi:MAG: DUF4230 domain-containing protein [Clostridia bacterium]|nr:DUF4230 domain-containing protein [Clostridia bacterium]
MGKKFIEIFKGLLSAILKNVWSTIVALAVVVLIVLGLIVGIQNALPSPEAKIFSTSTLEKIIDVSKLSTFYSTYNGIANVANNKNPENIDYYVSYEGKVKAGFDFEKLKITVDDKTETIKVEIPEIVITDLTVEIRSLDFIFMNNKANTATTSEEAYKKCIEDLKTETENNSAILELARENAVNVVKALFDPIISQLDSEYKLVVE